MKLLKNSMWNIKWMFPGSVWPKPFINCGPRYRFGPMLSIIMTYLFPLTSNHIKTNIKRIHSHSKILIFKREREKKEILKTQCSQRVTLQGQMGGKWQKLLYMFVYFQLWTGLTPKEKKRKEKGRKKESTSIPSSVLIAWLHLGWPLLSHFIITGSEPREVLVRLLMSPSVSPLK